MKRNFIYTGDCLKILKTFGNEIFDFCLTSPPYDDLREYDNKSDFDFEKFKRIAKELFRVLKKGGVLVWVVGDATVKGSETSTSFKQALYFKNIGFRLHDTMIYHKESTPYPSKDRYNQAFEYMFVLSKGKPKTFNPLHDRTKYKNSEIGKVLKKTQRNSDGTLEKTESVARKLKIKSNVWTISAGYNHTTQYQPAFEHPAMFPEELAIAHIRSWTNRGDLVLDPFAGAGTTLVAAKLLDRDYVGIEINPVYVEIAKDRLQNEELLKFKELPTVKLTAKDKKQIRKLADNLETKNFSASTLASHAKSHLEKALKISKDKRRKRNKAKFKEIKTNMLKSLAYFIALRRKTPKNRTLIRFTPILDSKITL